MQGYVTRKGERYYAVIYEGIDPLTGRERRRWHPAGTDQAVAERLACDLADRRRRDGGHERGSLTLAVYLTQRWLPSKQMALRPSTWDSYRRVIELHVVPRGRASPTSTSSSRSPRAALRRTARRRTCQRKRRTPQQDRRRDPHDHSPRPRRRRAAGPDPDQPRQGRLRPEDGDHCRATRRECGTPNNSQRSSPRPAITATTPRCG